MWTRKEVKRKAKQNLSRNYWSIFVSIFLFSAITGTVGRFMLKETEINFNRDIRYLIIEIMNNRNLFYNHNNFKNNKINPIDNIEVPNLDDMNRSFDDIDHPPFNDMNRSFDDMNRHSFDIKYYLSVIRDTCLDYTMANIYTTSFLAMILIFPLSVGFIRFLINSTKDKHRFEDLVSVFDKNYKYLVVSGLLTKLYIYFWSLLFIIPGIIKTYEYRMIPYILSENPDIGFTKAKDLSRKMTYGNKWKIFILDISFIGWYILGFMCCVVGVIFVKPYVVATKTELYLKLKKNIDLSEESVKLED